jgi:hypothetical protein
MSFAVGDVVTWTSQALGYRKTKAGEVAEIVKPGYMPSRNQFERLYRGSGVGLPRDHESYVVMVGTRPYWPRVSHLAIGGGLARATVAARKS